MTATKAEQWVTIPAAAALVGMSGQNLRQTYIEKLDAKHVKNGRPMRLFFPALLESIVQARIESALRSRPTITDDPLLQAGESIHLERYRAAKASHAELDLEVRRGELIDREKARDILGRWATLIRRMGERLSKRWGNDAAAMLNETLDECGLIVTELQGREGGDVGITKSSR